MLTHGPFPPDIRIEKEAIALVQTGYEVTVVANSKMTQKHVEDYRGIKVTYLKMRSFRGIYIAGISDLLKIARHFNPDVIHVHDIPMAPYATIVARILNCKEILDLHEIWSYLQLSSAVNRILRYLAFAAFFIVEVVCVHSAHIIIGVVEEASEEISRIYRIDKHKISVIMNLASFNDFDGVQTLRDSALEGRFVVTYVGGIERLRGLETAFRALEYLNDLDDLIFVIVGGERRRDGPRRTELERLVRSLRVRDKVYLTGWLPFKTAMSYIARSDICLLPHDRTRLTDRGLPHKVTQYMYFGKPVISNSLKPIVRLFGEAVVVYEGSSIDLANAVRKVYFDRELRAVLAQKGKELILTKYNWDSEKQKLLTLYERLSSDLNK